MANVLQVLKAEIVRISRRETRGVVGGVVRSTKRLKKEVTHLRKTITHLEMETKRLQVAQAKQQVAAQHSAPQQRETVRMTSKGVRSLRKKLRLSRPDFAKLCGTSAQTVYMWEKKEGDLKLRPKTKAALLSLRGLGVREAKRRLAEGQGEKK